MSEERQAWIALASVEGIGDVHFTRLLERWGSATAALEAVARLPDVDGDRALASAIGTRRQRGLAAAVRAAARDPDHVPRRVANLGGWCLTPMDSDYPVRLARIAEAPHVLYGMGDRGALTRRRCIAVVGTRSPTPGARHIAARVATRLTEAGASVVSGLAVGIDGVAHRAVIDAGGETVAVIGSGMDTPGPAAHRSLARRIAGHGAVVGELAPGSHATRGTFPRRNRIISGLATATIVVEAPIRSGALITARHALEQGRGLLVAPGPPFDRRVAGNLALLRETPATPLVGLDEMLADLGLDTTEPAAEGRPRLSMEGAISSLGSDAAAVARALAHGAQTADALVRASRLDARTVAAALTVLQLRGWARVVGPMQLPAGPLLGSDDGA